MEEDRRVLVAEEKLASFRESLKDVVVIVQKLGPLVSSVAQLAEVCELATTHDGQTRLLYSLVAEGKKK